MNLLGGLLILFSNNLCVSHDRVDGCQYLFLASFVIKPILKSFILPLANKLAFP